MAKTIEIRADKREELGRKAKRIRAQGLIPAVVYGKKIKSIPISIDKKEYIKNVLQSEAGSNLIFTLKIKDDGKATAVPVITQVVERNPLDDEIMHLDFMHIVMDEAIKARIPVELVGLPFGVKEEGGVLVHGLREIEVKCLPGDIPDKFEIDVSLLKINESLRVSDLKVSKKVEILASQTEMIANVSPPTKEEEVAPPALTPLEAEAAAAVAEGQAAVAEEGVKEKGPPGAAPPKGAPLKEEGKPEKPAKK